MSTDAPVALYELVLEDGRSASPYVWRIRYALAHKGIPFESRPVGFTEIRQLHGGRFKTVPILAHGTTVLNESWQIAEYLDRTFPQQPLFTSAAENATVRLTDAWLMAEVVRRMFFIYVLDVHNAARPADRAYFRASREEWLKCTSLEAFTAERATYLPKLRAALAPLRAHLAHYPFLGGAAPSYADYLALGYFLWVASVATLPMLAHDDEVLRGWLERGFDLYGGLARDPRARPLFEAAARS
jgi:glutathione S-transferase